MARKKLSLYKKIFLSVVLVFVVLYTIGSVIVWSYLDAFEQSRPKHVAEKVFNQYFASLNIGELVEKFPSDAIEFEDAESINKSVKASFDPKKFVWLEVSSNTDKSVEYAVSYENKLISYFTVSPTENEIGFGFNEYKLTGAEIFLEQCQEILVKVPTGYKLFVNGKEVENEYITEAGIEHYSCKHMLKGVNGITYNLYKMDGFVFEPEIKAVSSSGEAAKVEFNKTEGCYEVGLIYNDELKSRHSDYVIRAISEYTKYMSKDATFGDFAAYLDKSHVIYKKMQSIDTWFKPHESFEITNQKASEFYGYKDGVFSCRVNMKQRIERRGYEDHIVNVDVVLFLHNKNGKYLIYDMVIN